MVPVNSSWTASARTLRNLTDDHTGDHRWKNFKEAHRLTAGTMFQPQWPNPCLAHPKDYTSYSVHIDLSGTCPIFNWALSIKHQDISVKKKQTHSCSKWNTVSVRGSARPSGNAELVWSADVLAWTERHISKQSNHFLNTYSAYCGGSRSLPSVGGQRQPPTLELPVNPSTQVNATQTDPCQPL